MLNAPRCVPIYRHGRLEHFADMRGFILDRALVSRRTDTEGGSSSGPHSIPEAGAAAASIKRCCTGEPCNSEICIDGGYCDGEGNPITKIVTGLEGRGR